MDLCGHSATWWTAVVAVQHFHCLVWVLNPVLTLRALLYHESYFELSSLPAFCCSVSKLVAKYFIAKSVGSFVPLCNVIVHHYTVASWRVLMADSYSLKHVSYHSSAQHIQKRPNSRTTLRTWFPQLVKGKWSLDLACLFPLCKLKVCYSCDTPYLLIQ